mmetsp:Transcript_14368/g.35904  ORF Transcript_14368/g.35904 Transcript_14368/m.35904 type:complete len:88 (-) Transcript_14368:129-392(-)
MERFRWSARRRIVERVRFVHRAIDASATEVQCSRLRGCTLIDVRLMELLLKFRERDIRFLTWYSDGISSKFKTVFCLDSSQWQGACI